jgi:Tfp pilus assembly protein PilN
MPAKSKAKKKDQINLLPQEGLSASIRGRILLWLLSTFRYIVIITELFVVAAFIARFWLDAKNTNLSDEIQQNKAVIESYQDFEKDFKGVQKRLIIYNAYAQDRGKIMDIINAVITTKPPEITYSTITADETGMKISARSVSEMGIQQFLVNLKANEKIDNVSLGNISINEGEYVYTFDVTLTYKKM